MDQSIATSPRPSPPLHGGEGVGDSLRQCERCLRYWEGSGVEGRGVVVHPPFSSMVGFPELRDCGLPDCASVAALVLEENQKALLAAQMAVARQRVAIRRKVLERSCGKKPKSRKHRIPPHRDSASNIEHPTSNAERRTSKGAGGTPGGAQPAVPGWSSCPRDTEPLEENAKCKMQNEESIGSSQAEFHGAVDVMPAVNKLLLYFHEHREVWIPMTKLEEIAGAHAVHSRIVEVRAALKHDLDIDQENRFYAPTGTVHSHYRLCLKSVSVRLKRAAEREQDARQGTLTTNEHE